MNNQTWWNNNAKKNYTKFKDWVGDATSESKIYMATYLKNKNMITIADLGCGDATFNTTLKQNDINIRYVGVDSCAFFIKMNVLKGIPMINSDIRNIKDLSDSSIDIVFSRHTLEHQNNFRDELTEMIRIAKYEACHIFFIKPQEKETISYTIDDNLFHNIYSQTDIDTFLKNNPKVLEWKWVDINDKENALHIYVK